MGQAEEMQAARLPFPAKVAAPGSWKEEGKWMAVILSRFHPLLVEPEAGWAQVEGVAVPSSAWEAVFRSLPLPVLLRRQLRGSRVPIAQ